MPRVLDNYSKIEYKNRRLYIFYIIELQLDSGYVRLTTAHKDVTFTDDMETPSLMPASSPLFGNTYLASGKVLKIGNPKETQELDTSTVNISLSGVPTDLLSSALSQVVFSRRAVLYRGLMNPTTYKVVGNPLHLYSGLINSFSFSESVGDTATLNFTTKSVFADFNRSAGRRTNSKDQEVYLSIRGQASGTVLFGAFNNQFTFNKADAALLKHFGQTINNLTDGSTATITSVLQQSSIIYTTPLTGGTNNTWATGDSYEILAPVDKGFEFAADPQADLKWGRV